MNQGLVQWRSHCLLSSSIPLSSILRTRLIISANNSQQQQQQQQQQEQELSAREKRQLRNERRASNSTNWREQVEERLIKKPKKRFATWTEELNLDTLAKLGPQWWVVRVGRVRTVDTAELLARLLARNFPEIDFQVYTAAVNVKRKLKNGTCLVKPKPLFPGCVFLRCVLNREIHDFIRECEGVGGFVGSKVGNTKKQINKPRPVSDVDMEAIFKRAKEEQEKTDLAFEDEQKEENLNSRMLSVDTNLDPNDDTQLDPNDDTQSVPESKSRRVSKKASDSVRNGSSTAKKYKLLVPGSTVRVVSGTFAEFVGSLKKVNRKTGKATVGFTLFGKESLVDLDVNDVVAETN